MSNPYRDRGGAGTGGCPCCGVPLPEAERHCAGCGEQVRSLRCFDCYHLSLPNADDCEACARPLGLEPVGEPVYVQCPDCRSTMDAFRGNEGNLYDCSRCGGQFAENRLLAALLQRREAYGSTLRRPLERRNPLSQAVRYRSCPMCNAQMARKNFGRVSGVIVDVCPRDGVWFDIGELPGVLAFVESGGLERTRRVERDQQKQRLEQRQRDVVTTRLGGSRRPESRRLSGDNPVLQDLATYHSLMELLR